MKKRFAISALIVLFMLIVSQITWIRQIAERDKSRFEKEVGEAINDIVKYQSTKQAFIVFGGDPESPNMILQSVHPDSVSPNAKSYGSYETESYKEKRSISLFVESSLTEMLLEENTLDLDAIDTLLLHNFPYASELSAYTFKMQNGGKTIDSLYGGINAIQQLNDTTKGVYITIPLGTSGNYRFISHFIFKPAVATRQLTLLVIVSSVAVIAVAIIFFQLLHQLQQQKNRFHFQKKRIRGIVHDLKIPLNYIYFMFDLFEMDEESDKFAEGKSRVKRMSDAVERLLSEIKLNEKGSAALTRESFDLGQHLDELSNDLQQIYNEKKITMTFNVAPEARTIFVDPFYFSSCLSNLLDNSIKYSDSMPVITITAEKEKNKTIITIADQGVGIPKMERRKVFSDFYRSSRHSAEKGHGIGLSSVYQIITAHGGKVRLKSEEGKGTVFTIILPKNRKTL